MEAAGTGHHLISTIHADSALNIPWRMVDMAKLNGSESERMFRQVHQNINIGIYIHYSNDENGSHRKVTEVCEFYLDENSKPQSHMLYEFDYNANSYQTSKIISKGILSKIRRSKADISKIKDIFITDTGKQHG